MASRLTSIPGLDFLTREQMVGSSTAGSGAVETAFEFTIPRGEARKFLRVNGRLTLGAKDTFNGDGATTAFVLSHAISNSPRAFPIPAVALVGGVARTYVAAGPGAGEFTVNFATKTVTFGAAPGAGVGNVVVYYPPVNADGTYAIEVFNPNGRRAENFGNGTIRRINSVSQDDINSPWQMGETPWLAQDYILRIQAKSLSDVNVDAGNPYTQVELPFVRKPLAQMSKDEYAELVSVIGQ